MTGPSRSKHLTLISGAVICALGFYTIYDSVILGVSGGQRLIYGAVLAGCLLVLVVGARQIALSAGELIFLVLYVVCNALWLIPVPAAQNVYLTYVIGDITSLMMPIVFLLIGAIDPGLFRSRSALVLLCVLLLFAAMLGVVGSVSGRFEPPHVLLLALLWLGAGRSTGLGRMFFWAALLLVLFVAFESGARASVVLWLLGGVYILALYWPVRKLLLVVGPVAAIAVVLAGSLIQQEVVSLLQETRFSKNVEGEVDNSLLSRFNEASDAMNEFGNHAGSLNYIFGFGHGSTFQPVHSSLRNAIGDGVVHNIHIGPVLVFFRYGLLGVAVYVLLIVSVFLSFLRHRRSGGIKGPSGGQIFFTFAMTMYLADGLVHNVFVDPAFSFVLGGYLHFLIRRTHAFPLYQDSGLKFVPEQENQRIRVLPA